jgi:hypothetical protein
VRKRLAAVLRWVAQGLDPVTPGERVDAAEPEPVWRAMDLPPLELATTGELLQELTQRAGTTGPDAMATLRPEAEVLVVVAGLVNADDELVAQAWVRCPRRVRKPVLYVLKEAMSRA